uniref:Uncharacterized protein n=1 Tax=Anguilla anguilla TaxID=7936 RepID=A0A0E9XDB4_ANGAN
MWTVCGLQCPQSMNRLRLSICLSVSLSHNQNKDIYCTDTANGTGSRSSSFPRQQDPLPN